MANLTDWYDEVLPDLPGAQTDIVLHAIRRALIYFCERSLAYWHTPADIDVVSGTHTYTPAVPTDTEIAKVRQAWYDNNQLHIVSSDDLNNFYLDWQNESNPPEYLTQESVSTVRLVPNPSADLTAGLSLRLALKPTATAATIGGDIFDRYYDVIGYGAKARLMASPKKPYSSTEHASYFDRKFKDGIASAAIDAAKGFTRAPLRTAGYYGLVQGTGFSGPRSRNYNN